MHEHENVLITAILVGIVIVMLLAMSVQASTAPVAGDLVRAAGLP